MTRILAHKIVFKGKCHRLSIAEISDDRLKVQISPFVTELQGTLWIEGTVEITCKGGQYIWQKQK